MIESEDIQVQEPETKAESEKESRTCSEQQNKEVLVQIEFDLEGGTKVNQEKEENLNSQIDALKKEFDGMSSPEEKLSKVIEIMAHALSQKGNPDFKTFWDARKVCLDLFKENIPPSVKAVYWTKYRELTKEAKRLKDIFEEQSAFAVEQIDMAIQALEKDIETFAEQLEKVPSPAFPKGLKALESHYLLYLEKQRELNLLNTQAARINALRKELIRTDMRIRKKNSFFQRLSAAGDSVFPKRKELIKEISQLFLDDISEYVKVHFLDLDKQKSLHPLREEIKTLQSVAKTLTLNTNSFTKTRMTLSECWDKVKAAEKERKTQQTEKRQVYKENAEEVREKIHHFSGALAENKLSTQEVLKKYEEANSLMRSKELGRDELRALKEELSNAYKPLKSILLEEEKKKKEAAFEKEEARQNMMKNIEDRALKLSAGSEKAEYKEIAEEMESIHSEIGRLELTDFEKDGLVRLLIPAKDALYNKEAEEVLALPDENGEKSEKLKDVLRKTEARKSKIKEQIEKYRKACGSSGLDFEQSMFFNEQLNAEKLRLEKHQEFALKIESALLMLEKGH